MRNKIEEGEWVRTKGGKIGVFIRYSSRKNESLYKSPFDCFIKLSNRKSYLQCHRDYIIKHSKNKIDLVEVGDYVNGHKVVNETYGEDDNNLYFEVEGGFNKAKYISEKDIKTIVTKEQFKEREYVF